MFKNVHTQMNLSRAAAWSLVAGLLLAAIATTAQAQIQDFAVADQNPLLRFGPKSPTNGYPMWVQDANGVTLELCEDTNDQISNNIDPLTGFPFAPCPACVDPLLDLPDPTLPQSFPDNYPDEHFFALAESLMIESDNTRSIITTALEGAFDGLGAVVDGEQIVFARYRVRIDNATPGQLYQITYPYGVTYAEAQNDQAGAAISNINFTNDVFLWKGITLRLDSIMSTFLTSVNAPPLGQGPAGTSNYLTDFCGDGPVMGSPFGTNFFSVVGPDAGIVRSTLVAGNPQPSASQCNPLDPAMDAAFAAYDAYVIANIDPNYLGLPRIPANCTRSDGFVGIAKQASQLGVQVDRATYNSSQATGTQINVWASSFEGQDIQLTIPGIAGDIPLCGDGTGNYFANVLLPSTFIPQIDPATITPTFAGNPTVIVTNFTDSPPTVSTHTLSALIQVTQAQVDLATNMVNTMATVADPAQMSNLTVSLGGNTMPMDPAIVPDAAVGGMPLALVDPTCGGVVPPAFVTVSSAQGGSVSVQTTIKGVVPQALAAAGGNQTKAKGSIVTLDGSGSIGIGLTYSWSLALGSTDITIDPLWTPFSATTGFTFPSADDLITITLTVTDTLGVTSSDTIFVTNTVMAAAGLDQNFLPPPNGPGFPDAGVLLDASSSQGVGLSFSWAQIPVDLTASPQCVNDALDGAVSIAIDPANAALATASMPLTGGCVTLELTASGPGGFATDTVTIKAPVGAPAASAGVDIVTFASQMVQLDASASTGLINSPTSTPPGFVWTQLAGGTDTVALGKTVAGGIEYISATTGLPFTVDPNVDAIPAAADVTAPNITLPVFVFPATFQTLTFQVDVTGPGGMASATVNVIMDNPATADILTPTRARYVENKDRFSVSGTTDHMGGNGYSVTCWLAAPGAPLTDANLIGTAPVIPNTFDWKVDVFGGLNPCIEDPGIVDTANCKNIPIADHQLQVQCISSLGGTLDAPLDWEAK